MPSRIRLGHTASAEADLDTEVPSTEPKTTTTCLWMIVFLFFPLLLLQYSTQRSISLPNRPSLRAAIGETKSKRNITELWELYAFDWRFARALALIIGVKIGVCKVTKREKGKKN